MAGVYPGIPNGVIVLSVNNNSVQEMYTAHVAPATFSDKDRWFIKRDKAQKVREHKFMINRESTPGPPSHSAGH